MNESDHEVLMTRREVFDLAMRLDQWAAVARGDKGRHNDLVLMLKGHRLSHDIERASALISHLIGEAQNVDMRHIFDEPEPGKPLSPEQQEEKRLSIEWHDAFMRECEIARRIVDRLLGPDVQKFWDICIGEGGDDDRSDLIALAANAGDTEARELLARGSRVEARLWPQLGHVVHDDRCVPSPAVSMEAAYVALNKALDPAVARSESFIAQFFPPGSA